MMSSDETRFVPVAFSALPHWAADDHGAAFAAFLISSRRLLQRAAEGAVPATPPALLNAARLACDVSAAGVSPADARLFFETHFVPHRVVQGEPHGLLTGYYEPVIAGSRERTHRFSVPVLRRPADLVNLVAESERGAKAEGLTHARQTIDGLEPYATREEIENGALAGQGLELVWLEDAVDAFFLHVQGSGMIALEDGTQSRITYDGKNGHPYTSVGRYVIDAGLFPADKMSLDALKDWLRADLVRGLAAMRQNKSYVFFRELTGAQAGAALGAMEIPLTDHRSLAVDTRTHALGTPVYVVAPTLVHAGGPDGFHRLMIAQDVGSAIRGPERGDIFFGSGDEAGAKAGITKHPGNFFVLLPDGLS
jgi:membrane-bound lytic murein transglycosylase A